MTAQNMGASLPQIPEGLEMTYDELGRPIFIPKYIKQISDLKFGETVTHENLNEKLNLNTTQGDQQAYVLDVLLHEHDPDKAFHIGYLDDAIEELDLRLTAKDEQLQSDVDMLDGRMTDAEENLVDNNTLLDKMISGEQVVGRAHDAEQVAGADLAGPYKYFGTNLDNEVGYFPVPETMYAEIIHGGISVDGVYFIPGVESILESHLSPELQAKVNRAFIADYDELTGRPYLNGYLLSGNVSLADIGAQPVGNYLTSVPSEYVIRTELAPFAIKDTVDANLLAHTTNPTTHADIRAAITSGLSALDTTLRSFVNGKFTRVSVGSWNNTTMQGAPRAGDLVVNV